MKNFGSITVDGKSRYFETKDVKIGETKTHNVYAIEIDLKKEISAPPFEEIYLYNHRTV